MLKLTGPFSLGEVHSWIGHILPNVPEQPANVSDLPSSDGGGTNTLYFKSTFVATELEVVYRRGEAVFRSDNISTISVLKEVLSKETSSKKVLVKITHGEAVNIKPGVCVCTCMYVTYACTYLLLLIDG